MNHSHSSQCQRLKVIGQTNIILNERIQNSPFKSRAHGSHYMYISATQTLC